MVSNSSLSESVLVGERGEFRFFFSLISSILSVSLVLTFILQSLTHNRTRRVFKVCTHTFFTGKYTIFLQKKIQHSNQITKKNYYQILYIIFGVVVSRIQFDFKHERGQLSAFLLKKIFGKKT